MSKVICEREDIVAIADAVRSKGNTTEAMTLGEIETAVYNIKSAIPTQEKTVDITANGTVEVTPDEGYVMSKVTANVNVPKDGVDKIQRYIELNGSMANHLFYGFLGTSVDELLNGVDTSKARETKSMFGNCQNITTIPLIDTSIVTAMDNMFYRCQSLTAIPLLNTSEVDTINGMFEGCSALRTIPLLDTGNVTNMNDTFSSCSQLTTIPTLDMRKVTSASRMFQSCSNLTNVPSLDMRKVTSASTLFYSCKALTECWIRNIKTDIQVGYGSGTGYSDYGHLLTLDSLLHLCKECRKTTSSRTLTVGTANLAKLEGIYVKLIDITDEMRAEDDLIDEKYPFVQCDSTDDGAMTIADYMATKLWTLK